MQTKHPNNSNSTLWMGLMLLLLAILKLSIQIWGLNKGYDITDEGLYILMLNFSEQYPAEPHNYYTYILHAVLPLESYSLLFLRWFSLILETLGLSYFAICVYQWLRVNAEINLAKGQLILFTFLMAAFISVYPRAFSYNDLSYLNTMLVTATMLLVFRGSDLLSQLKHPLVIASLLFIGILIGEQLIVKFSTSILLFIWVYIYLILKYSKWKAALISNTIVLAGAVFFWGMFFKGYTGFIEWYDKLIAGVKLLKLIAYDPYGVFIQGYVQVDIIENAQYYLAPLLAAFLLKKTLPKFTKLTDDTTNIVAYVIGLLVWLVWSSTVHQYFLGEFYYRFIAIHIYTLLFFLIPFAYDQAQQKNWQWFGYSLLVVALPFISLSGSNNPMTQTLTRYLAPWALLVYVLMHHQVKKVLIKNTFITLIVAVTFINYIVTQIYNPYALPDPLTEQTTPLNNLHYVDGIVVAPSTAEMFDQISSIAKGTGFKQGYPVLALGDICGVATAIGGYIPETFWYFSDESATSPQHSRNYSCIHLNNLQISEHKAFPLLIISESTHQQVLDCLANSQVPYPDSYHKSGEVYSPYRQEKLYIWAPDNWIP